jgi:hypothetical protein
MARLPKSPPPPLVGPEVQFQATLWVYPGPAAWMFVTLPTDLSAEIKGMSQQRRGFGSLRVDVTVADIQWRTSIFPDSKAGAFLLPVKAAVRQALGLVPGDTVDLVMVVEV